MSKEKHYNQYVERFSIHDKNKIQEFLSLDKIYSNQKNYKKKANMLLDYESKRKKGEKSTKEIVYAVSLRVMLPKHLSLVIKHDIVKNFMLKIHPKIKDLLYLYHFIKIGNGEYVDIILFERQIYKHIHYENKLYIRDMYIDKVTGRTCSKNSPNAVHRCQKGKPKLDKNGNVIKEARFISPKKYRYLNYHDHRDEEIKKKNFNNLIDRLKKCLVRAVSKLSLSNYLYYTLRRKKFDVGDKTKRLKAYMFNNVINHINLRLREIQNTFHYRGLYWDRNESWRHFERIFFSLNRILENGSVKFGKQSLRLDTKSDNSIANLRSALNIFEKIADDKIKEFYHTEFYDFEFDKYVM